MKISELAHILKLTVVDGDYRDIEVAGAYTSDLLSDVIANCPGQSVLVTIQAHKNTVAVASLVGVGAIILCNSRTPTADTVEAAHTEGIALLLSSESQYTISGKIWVLLGNEA